jgi:predicted nucleic acid-binding protein
VAVLVDTNVLVYRYDARSPDKQAVASSWLRRAVISNEARISHQALVEFVAATTRSPGGAPPLLSPTDAIGEAEDLIAQFPILYPTEEIFRLALRGMAAYQLAWFDAHMWAYAEHHGLTELWTEDFQDGRHYGSVLAVNPFAAR